MSKRFTDTEKWSNDWFIKLEDKEKIVWQYVLDKCNFAGIFEKNFILMNLLCKTQYDDNLFNKIFQNKIINFENFYFIPDFLKLQYPQGLNSNMPAIKSVLKELKKHNLTQTVIEQLGKGYLTLKDKDKDKDKDVTAVKDVEVKDSNSNSNKKEIKTFKIPTLEEVENYINANKLNVNAQKFHAYYTSNGWKVGKNSMKNWRAAVVVWKNNSY